ncbi:MAG: rhomboid family intramembrane serine protease [Saprospiraceae bacterium]|nr:rhomboid family intramembrane serine protease [Saprospiraceae bacterium]
MESFSNQKESLLYSSKVTIGLGAIIILVHLLITLFDIDRSMYSIYPRDINQWYGIFTGHFLHSTWTHLFSNLAPLCLTMFMIFFFYQSIGWAVFSLILMLTGFAVFMFARESSHLGASGLVYGLISFVFFSGIFRRNAKSIILMVIVVILYGGYSAGLLPVDEKVSWESHLFGALTGLWTAFIFRNFRESDEKEVAPSWANDSNEKSYFFERDTFDKTLEERRKEEEERNKQSPDNFNSTYF